MEEAEHNVRVYREAALFRLNQMLRVGKDEFASRGGD